MHRTVVRSLLAAACLTAVAAAGCYPGDAIPGVAGPRVAPDADTVRGTGSVAELMEQRALWQAQRAPAYRYDLAVLCFCPADYARPVRVFVSGLTVIRVEQLEEGPVSPGRQYPTVEELFAAAIDAALRGTHVDVTYYRETGQLARLTIGELANDSGVGYWLGPAVATP